jgi:hypothetical protein
MWESENQDESPLMTTDNFHGIDRLGRLAAAKQVKPEHLPAAFDLPKAQA